MSAGVSMLIVEVPMVFADKYLNYRYKLGREEGALAERKIGERYLDELDEARRTGSPEPPRPTAKRNDSVSH